MAGSCKSGNEHPGSVFWFLGFGTVCEVNL